jgi:hypothetical protein
MTDDNIDYDKLSTMVALKLRQGINAAVHGRDALDETWLAEYLQTWLMSHNIEIANQVFNTHVFDGAFKLKLKYAPNNFSNNLNY